MTAVDRVCQDTTTWQMGMICFFFASSSLALRSTSQPLPNRHVYCVATFATTLPISVILVQQFIFILVFIQFYVNHFYSYSYKLLYTVYKSGML